MDLKEIKRIIDMVQEANISSLAIEHENLKIEIKKEMQILSHTIPIQASNIPAQIPQSPIQQSQVLPDPKPTESSKPSNLTAITSPMVGTFYSSSSPDTPPYLKVGDKVSAGQVICIIEAMKIFNEIEAEINGVVEQICAVNGKPVEYAQDLFLIRES